jgi:succinate dehydrogenase flavin-adding protein (antitoxin of CptAB toxin-antitoxin module)
MKTKQAFVYGIFAVIFALTLAACGDGGSGGDNKDPATVPVNKLELTGDVYLGNWNDERTGVTYTPFTDDLTIYGINQTENETGEITKGKLKYSVGAPRQLSEIDTLLERFSENHFENVKSSVTNAKYSSLSMLTNELNYNRLLRENFTTVSESENVYEMTAYVYVDKDVTVSGNGTVYDNSDTGEDVIITEDFSLALKTGWNAVYHKEIVSGDNPKTRTRSLSLGGPALKWVLWEFDE